MIGLYACGVSVFSGENDFDDPTTEQLDFLQEQLNHLGWVFDRTDFNPDNDDFTLMIGMPELGPHFGSLEMTFDSPDSEYQITLSIEMP
jgi:hypothetical protein